MRREAVGKLKDDMRVEYRREDLGKLVRGKFFKRMSKGTNLVLVNGEVARSFPKTASKTNPFKRHV